LLRCVSEKRFTASPSTGAGGRGPTQGFYGARIRLPLLPARGVNASRDSFPMTRAPSPRARPRTEFSRTFAASTSLWSTSRWKRVNSNRRQAGAERCCGPRHYFLLGPCAVASFISSGTRTSRRRSCPRPRSPQERLSFRFGSARRRRDRCTAQPQGGAVGAIPPTVEVLAPSRPNGLPSLGNTRGPLAYFLRDRSGAPLRRVLDRRPPCRPMRRLR
jgi:hypothetical protein